jgi:ParB/RepB/Spo0J family partition protein
LEIPIQEVFIPPDRQRKAVKEPAIAELAVSIQAKGQLHPITVTEIDRVRFPDAKPHIKYQLVAGYRRLLPTVKAELLANLTHIEQEEIELDENLMRENLSWQDEIKAKARLVELRKELYGDSIRDVATHVGESRGELWEDQRLAKAIELLPELANSKNKTQAQNKLRLLQRREKLTEKAAELASGKGDTALLAFDSKVKLGDALTIVKTWPSAVFNCIITDPPYGIDLDKGETKKGNAHPAIYADATYDVMDLYAQIVPEAYRILQDNTHAYFFFDIKQYARIFKLLTDAGFTVDPIPLLWVKPGSGQVNHPDSRWGSGYEACFFCRKGNRALLKQGQSNVLMHDPVPSNRKIHPVEKPVSLLRQLIESSTAPGETVIDFFGGSGSTAEAAIQTGRNFLLCEKDPAFHAGILERLAALTKTPPAPQTTVEEDDETDWEEARARNKKEKVTT